MVAGMLDTQNKLNIAVVGEKWPLLGLDWELTVQTETAELLDSLSSYWWKKTGAGPVGDYDSYTEWLKATDNEFDLPNVKVEVIDLMHFFLSSIIQESGERLPQVAQAMANILDKSDYHVLEYKTTGAHKDDIQESAKNFSYCFSAFTRGEHGSMDVFTAMIELIYACGMEFEEVYKLYTGKAVLNAIRTNNGYKEGTYIKVWNGVEDNVIMKEKLAELNADEVASKLPAMLQHYYITEVKNG